jgi:hypothetical protein
MRPVAGSRGAAKGGCDHRSASAGTKSRWELRSTEGRDGSESGQVRRSKGLVRHGVKWSVVVRRPRGGVGEEEGGGAGVVGGRVRSADAEVLLEAGDLLVLELVEGVGEAGETAEEENNE